MLMVSEPWIRTIDHGDGVGFFFGVRYSSLWSLNGVRRAGGVTPAASMARRIAAMVGGEGLKLPGRWPSAIKSGVQPYLFSRFHTSTFAPQAASRSTTFGALLYAAPCMAVSPLSSTALMSAPSSSSNLTA